jgi:trehalose 6-phosphate phosphatase
MGKLCRSGAQPGDVKFADYEGDCRVGLMDSPPATLNPVTEALFLDVDGTLLEIRDHPGDVVADAALVELLENLLAGFGGALALVSGRSVAEIDRIFAPVRFPSAGAHGAEIRLHASDNVGGTAAKLPADALTRLESFAASHEGLLLEHKNGGISLHYRRAPRLEKDCRALVAEILPSIAADFRLIAGKMVLELAPRGHNKGLAIREIMQCEPFAGRRPVFAGDDVTDEDGFTAVNDSNGISIRVGGNQGSAAICALDNVAAVRRWLESIMEQIAEEPGDGESSV